MNALLTDFYELTMAAGYFTAAKHHDIGVFEVTIRRLPKNRDFVVLAGLHRALDYLLNLSFAPEEIAWLRTLPNFNNTPPEFWDYLGALRFTGDVFAIPEGTVIYEGQPVMNVRAPLIEGQIAETYLLASISFETLIATKAARVVRAAGGRDVVEFGTRRAHTAEAGVLGARAAWIAGCAGTSNTLAGYRYGIPVMGTAAHSWIMSFESEAAAFRQLQQLLGERTIQLIDTYDTIEAAREVARLGKPLWGVRLDSGDFVALSKEVRRILDAAGLTEARIMASGDLDENKIAALVAAGAPIDAFGVGTELATSGDAPTMGIVYKLVEVESNGEIRPVAKSSPQKGTLPGAKQLFRYPEYDLLALHDECAAGSEALLRPCIIAGERVCPPEPAARTRQRAMAALNPWPPANRRMTLSSALDELSMEVALGRGSL